MSFVCLEPFNHFSCEWHEIQETFPSHPRGDLASAISVHLAIVPSQPGPSRCPAHGLCSAAPWPATSKPSVSLTSLSLCPTLSSRLLLELPGGLHWSSGCQRPFLLAYLAHGHIVTSRAIQEVPGSYWHIDQWGMDSLNLIVVP